MISEHFFRHVGRALSLLLLTALLLAGQSARPAYAAGYVVNSLGDTIANDGSCTLREAIQEANNGADTDCAGSPNAADDTITFGVNGTIHLGSTLPIIVSGAGALTINGTGRTITISGDSDNNGIPDVRVMVVNSGANLTLQNLTIAKGNASGTSSGGGIINYGTLSITNSTFFANYSANDGGGILNYFGTLSLTNSTFSGNYANGNGGGVYNYNGTLTVTDSAFSQNTANGGGGVVNSSGALTITDSTFSQNTANFDGGGVHNYGTLTITNSTFSGNSASAGGGVWNSGTLTLTNSTFSQNTAKSGGGVYNRSSGTLTITGSIFSGNSSTTSDGGGVYNLGTLTITNSTFSGNSASAGGGVANDFLGTLTLTNSTFSANSANTYGGGVFNSGTLTFINSTFSANSANTEGGGVRNFRTATLKNTIIANSTGGGDCVGTLSGTNNNNLIESTGAIACNLTNGVNGNIIGSEPNLGALTGSPAYFPLNPGSPAIDAGDNATCAAPPVYNQSQNGVTRPQDGDGNGIATCDIGSYEAARSIVFLPLMVK